MNTDTYGGAMHFHWKGNNKTMFRSGVGMAIVTTVLTLLPIADSPVLFLLLMLFNSMIFYVCFLACQYARRTAEVIDVRIQTNGAILITVSYMKGSYYFSTSKEDVDQVLFMEWDTHGWTDYYVGLKLKSGSQVWLEGFNKEVDARDKGVKLAIALKKSIPNAFSKCLAGYEVIDDYRNWMTPENDPRLNTPKRYRI